MRAEGYDVEPHRLSLLLENLIARHVSIEDRIAARRHTVHHSRLPSSQPLRRAERFNVRVGDRRDDGDVRRQIVSDRAARNGKGADRHLDYRKRRILFDVGKYQRHANPQIHRAVARHHIVVLPEHVPEHVSRRRFARRARYGDHFSLETFSSGKRQFHARLDRVVDHQQRKIFRQPLDFMIDHRARHQIEPSTDLRVSVLRRIALHAQMKLHHRPPPRNEHHRLFDVVIVRHHVPQDRLNVKSLRRLDDPFAARHRRQLLRRPTLVGLRAINYVGEIATVDRISRHLQDDRLGIDERRAILPVDLDAYLELLIDVHHAIGRGRSHSEALSINHARLPSIDRPHPIAKIMIHVGVVAVHRTLARRLDGDLQPTIARHGPVDRPIRFDIQDAALGDEPRLGRQPIADHLDRSEADRTNDRLVGHALDRPLGARLAQRLDLMTLDLCGIVYRRRLRTFARSARSGSKGDVDGAGVVDDRFRVERATHLNEIFIDAIAMTRVGLDEAVAVAQRREVDRADAVAINRQLKSAGVDAVISARIISRVEQKIAGVVNDRTPVVILNALQDMSMAAEDGVGAQIDQQSTEIFLIFERLRRIVDAPMRSDEYDIGMRSSVGNPRGENVAPLIGLTRRNIPRARLIVVGAEVFRDHIEVEKRNDKIVDANVNRVGRVVEIFAAADMDHARAIEQTILIDERLSTVIARVIVRRQDHVDIGVGEHVDHLGARVIIKRRRFALIGALFAERRNNAFEIDNAKVGVAHRRNVAELLDFADAPMHAPRENNVASVKNFSRAAYRVGIALDGADGGIVSGEPRESLFDGDMERALHKQTPFDVRSATDACAHHIVGSDRSHSENSFVEETIIFKVSDGVFDLEKRTVDKGVDLKNFEVVLGAATRDADIDADIKQRRRPKRLIVLGKFLAEVEQAIVDRAPIVAELGLKKRLVFHRKTARRNVGDDAGGITDARERRDFKSTARAASTVHSDIEGIAGSSARNDIRPEDVAALDEVFIVKGVELVGRKAQLLIVEVDEILAAVERDVDDVIAAAAAARLHHHVVVILLEQILKTLARIDGMTFDQPIGEAPVAEEQLISFLLVGINVVTEEAAILLESRRLFAVLAVQNNVVDDVREGDDALNSAVAVEEQPVDGLALEIDVPNAEAEQLDVEMIGNEMHGVESRLRMPKIIFVLTEQTDAESLAALQRLSDRRLKIFQPINYCRRPP